MRNYVFKYSSKQNQYRAPVQASVIGESISATVQRFYTSLLRMIESAAATGTGTGSAAATATV
eukprot:19993-Heterococcus_DN1.PRE.3